MAKKLKWTKDSLYLARYTMRAKLPHGWLIRVNDDTGGGITFVPFAENGTGWGPDDDLEFLDD